MRPIVFLCLLLICLAGCGDDDCPPCFNLPEPFRLAIIDADNENLLDPNNANGLQIDKLKLKSGQELVYELKDFIVLDDPLDFYFLEWNDQQYMDNCIDQDCEFYMSYQNVTKIDTINVFVEKITEEKNGCNCVGHQLSYVKYNGVVITEFDWEPNNTGAAIIIK